MFQAAGTYSFSCVIARPPSYSIMLIEPDAIVWQVTATCVHTHEAIIVMIPSDNNHSFSYSALFRHTKVMHMECLTFYKGN